MRDSSTFVEFEDDGYFYERGMLSAYRAGVAPLHTVFKAYTPDVLVVKMLHYNTFNYDRLHPSTNPAVRSKRKH